MRHAQLNMAADSYAAPRPRTLTRQAISRLDAQLTCSVCLDRYVDPRVLTCHHSFCKNCISRIPQERHQGRLVVKCPCCRESTPLGENEVSALPVAFLINNLLEIDGMLKKPTSEPRPNDAEKVCPKHNRQLEFYCETCKDVICFKCGTESHQQCQYDEFAKRKQELKSCFKPLNKQIQEVTDRLALFDVTEKNIKDQNEIVKEDIVQTIQEIADNLQRSKEFLLEQAERATRQKLQLNSLVREKNKMFLTELKKCKEFVEEEINLRSQYQIQAAKTILVKHILETCSKINTIHKPIEMADTSFMVDRSAYTFPIGRIESSLNCQAVCEFASVAVPSQTFAGPGQTICIPVTTPISVSPEQVTTTLTLEDDVFHPSVIQVDEGYLVICLQPIVTGLYELNVRMNGIPFKGSPFTIPVLPSAETREQKLAVVASDLKCPYNSVVTEDGQHIVVVEMECTKPVSIYTTTGQFVGRFGKFGKGPGKLNYPQTVAVSSSKEIFVGGLDSVEKFTFSGSHVKTLAIRVRGLVFHHQTGLLLAIAKNYNIEVFNLDLSHSHTLRESKNFVDACDLAVDTKGMVYVLTIEHGIHKFSSDLNKYVSSIDIQCQLKDSCLMGICIDKYDNIYVTDASGVDKPIIMLTAEGECVAKFGDRRHTRNVHGISVNKSGDLFVCCLNTGELVVYRA